MTPLGGQLGLGLEMGHLGSALMCLSVGPSSYWPVLVWGWGGNMRGLLLPWMAVTKGDEVHSLSTPLGWFKAVAGIGHSLAMWPHPWHL